MKHWPLYDLRLRTPRLELRLPTLAELDDLADVAVAGIHDPALMPFGFAWTNAEPAELARSVAQFQWRAISQWSPECWSLPLTVFLDGAPIGVQGLDASDFAIKREISSGSWLGRSFQGRGFGTEMRAALLHLAFEGLGALTALSGAHTDNPASIGVSRRLGYLPDGVTHKVVRGARVEELRFTIDRPGWDGHRTVDVSVEGLGPCLELFGLGEGR
ncbi:GNAT family N-acetyltransferase [Actinocorallia longicatena]|uniref:GNAT family protein n=1 Tax=Actinocorallia longicatena TaxID=111803 RepID=A0ABP6QGC8_9ACTN